MAIESQTAYDEKIYRLDILGFKLRTMPTFQIIQSLKR